ncbi:exported protein of unknown function [Pseudomonas sp. JV241A]|nr:exported protein of unknown function [Pseudomonas sp. JV241A]
MSNAKVNKSLCFLVLSLRFVTGFKFHLFSPCLALATGLNYFSGPSVPLCTSSALARRTSVPGSPPCAPPET